MNLGLFLHLAEDCIEYILTECTRNSSTETHIDHLLLLFSEK